MEQIKGYVEHIIFQNKENGYTVMNLVCDGDEITCVGILSAVSEGENLLLEGDYTEHPTYGTQFHFDRYEEVAPEDEQAIERYLGSGAIKGIGAALAARIVRRFHEDTFRIIEEEPERLAEIKGISMRKAAEISNQIAEKRDLRQAMLFLQQYGISLTLGVKIYQAYGQEIYSILKTNPYRLADDISGVGFRIADEIATKIGIRTDSDFRIRSGLLYLLQQAAGEGHTYLPKELLISRAVDLLQVDAETIEKNVMDLSLERKIICRKKEDVTQVYSQAFFHMEINVAAMLNNLDIGYDVPDAELVTALAAMERENNLILDEKQADAVREAARNGLLMITGGPGTGKTTTINAIIRYFEQAGLDLLLAAPTGRAAKRMSEMTGFEARTIHRMLEVNGAPTEHGGMFERNEQNPLEADVVIVDEMSMVDISLMHALLKALTPGTRLILVGDVNQLPSVGPGSVLKDMIASGCYHVVELKKIFRQASQSDIIVNAHKINAGEHVNADNKSKDFFFLRRNEADVIINVMLQLVAQKLPRYVQASPMDIQILSPMRKGVLGVERLNRILQKYLNPPSPRKKEREHGDVIFREGDKVMQTKNNYQLVWEVRSGYGICEERGTGVFNGDIGIIKSINDFTETVTVEFDERRQCEYPFKELEELEHAYATTIHKSQGSEYPAVVIPLLGGPKMLMNRNLLYTAVTRARQCVVLVGSEETFTAMIDNTLEQRRYSGLCDRIVENFEKQ